MKQLVNFTLNILNKSTKFLERDFAEIQMIKNSNHGLAKFIQHSYEHTKKSLATEFNKYSKDIIFAEDYRNDPEDLDEVFIIEPIDCITNFARGIPFFGLAILHKQKSNDDKLSSNASFIHFPVFKDIAYSFKASGAWLVNSNRNTQYIRMRVNETQNTLKNAILVTDDFNFKLDVENFNVRCLGSTYYHLMMFCLGQCDIFHTSYDNKVLSEIINLIVTEAGGSVIKLKRGYIASNFKLSEEIKGLVS